MWAEQPMFNSRQGQDFSQLHSVYTGSGADQTTYPMGTGDFFFRDKAAGA
jgi:hypothetical protein